MAGQPATVCCMLLLYALPLMRDNSNNADGLVVAGAVDAMTAAVVAEVLSVCLAFVGTARH